MLRSPTWAQFWAVVRILTAVVGTAAVVAQLTRTIENAVAASQPIGTVVANFFSFFTIQSNVAAAATLTIGAILFWRQSRRTDAEPRWFAVLLACVTTYMVITGIVYNLLLRGIQLPQGETVPWSNEVMHVAVPIVLLLDLFLAPRRRPLPWRAVWIIVIYPIAWVIYTLLRGPFVTSPGNGEPYWYPYPFLNPNNPGLEPAGYAGVAVYVVAIAAGIIAVGLLVVWVGRWRGVAARAEASVSPRA